MAYKSKRDVREGSKEKRRRKSSRIFRGVAFNMLTFLFFTIRVYFDKLLDLIFGYFWEGERKAIPPLEKSHGILEESAVALAAKIRNKQLTSEELVKACVERIKAVNPILNAVTDERFEAALEDARNVDQMIANGLPAEVLAKKPFLGVPFTTKESNAVAGLLHTIGIKARAHVRAHEDAECVRLLKEAGAIPLAVTNVPEVNKWQESRNYVFGQTNNPYHTGRTVGGSSGGEAAIAAAMGVPISLCSDIGGSTRMPAFFNGLFALNPTAGFTNLRGVALRSGEHPTMASIGFISRHCSDLAPLTKVVAGEKAKELRLEDQIDIKDIKFFYMESAKDMRVSPIRKDLRVAMNRVIQKLTEVATTDKVPQKYYHKGFDYMYSLWRHAMTKEYESFPKLLANNQGEVKAIVELPKKIFGMSEYTLASVLKLTDEQILPAVNEQWAEELTAELAQDLTSTLGAEGVLLCPSAPEPAPYHYALFTRPFNFSYWGILNTIRCPAVQVPLGLNSDGLPLGIQVVAAPKQEALCLSVAAFLEKEFGGFVPPCQILH